MAEGQYGERNRLTPTSASLFACLGEPKGYKGSTEDLAWNITISMDEESGAKFKKEVEEIGEKLRKDETARRANIKRPTRDVPCELTCKRIANGNYSFNFRKKEKGNTPPLVLDYHRNPISTKILPGTLVQVAYNINPYVLSSTNMFGVTLQLIAVRIMDKGMPDGEVQGVFSNAKLAESKGSKDEVNLDDLF